MTYPDSTRRGLLGQGSILVQTSLANRTSPVLRGKWVMEVLIGMPPPPPPPNVPTLDETQDGKDGQPLTTRERMEIHRKNPTCKTCHQYMDPIGLVARQLRRDGQVAVSRERRCSSTRAARCTTARRCTTPADLTTVAAQASDSARARRSRRT